MKEIADIHLHSFFAKLVKADVPIENLEYGIVYVQTNNDEDWQIAVEDIKKSLSICEMRGTWLMDYGIEVLPKSAAISEDSTINALFADGYNVIMPVFMPGRFDQYYLVGEVPEKKDLEIATDMLFVDAQNILEKCLPEALSTMDYDIEKLLDDFYEKICAYEIPLRVYSCYRSSAGIVSFRGKQSDEDACVADSVKAKSSAYKEERKIKQNLHRIAKRMQSSDEKVRNQARKEFDYVWPLLSPYEQKLFVGDIMETHKIICVKRASSNLNREQIGLTTDCEVIVLPWAKAHKKDYGINSTNKYSIFIRKENKQYPLKMQKSPAVIYLLSLIERKKSKDSKIAFVDIGENDKAFLEVYRLMFGNSDKEAIEKKYNELFHREASDKSGRLPECYKKIEKSLSDVFMEIDRNYLPFLVNATTPLCVSPEKITLPDEFLKVKIHQKRPKPKVS